MASPASISGVPTALLIIMQTLIAVSALPTPTTTTSATTTTTTTTSVSPQLERRQALDHSSNGMSPVLAATLVNSLGCGWPSMLVPTGQQPQPDEWTNKALGIPLPSPVSTAVTTLEDTSVMPAPENPISSPVLIYNDYSSTHLLGTYSNTFRNSQNGITGEDGIAPQNLMQFDTLLRAFVFVTTLT
ncbi:hypothetical protein B9Z19DRAFT_1066438 [Tuber borchii]|uniref:Uncharacterized protein n=1 Tax=Tuber borchii TaxID=42251 RepID=A0A2T6ZMH3_TUBBO|nr:hypothetical protein B9Z19DRAFT_1066438 [Tuber borchii]